MWQDWTEGEFVKGRETDMQRKKERERGKEQRKQKGDRENRGRVRE